MAIESYDGFQPQRAGLESPAAPHDPHERAVIHSRYGWQIRTYAWNTALHRYGAQKGMLHLQLWCPSMGLSILTPSELTAGHYEVSMAGESVRVCCVGTVAEIVYEWTGLRMPCSRVLSFYLYRMVYLPYLGASLSPEVTR